MDRKFIQVSAADFQRNIGRYQDFALIGTVAVTRNGRESCVLISSEEYKRLKRRDRDVLAIGDFTQDDHDAVMRSKAPAEAAEFDHELE
jgi:prevent-host-death family protein